MATAVVLQYAQLIILIYMDGCFVMKIDRLTRALRVKIENRFL